MILERTPPRREIRNDAGPSTPVVPPSAQRRPNAQQSTFTWEPLESMGSSRKLQSSHRVTPVKARAEQSIVSDLNVTVTTHIPFRRNALHSSAEGFARLTARNAMLESKGSRSQLSPVLNESCAGFSNIHEDICVRSAAPVYRGGETRPVAAISDRSSQVNVPLRATGDTLQTLGEAPQTWKVAAEKTINLSLLDDRMARNPNASISPPSQAIDCAKASMRPSQAASESIDRGDIAQNAASDDFERKLLHAMAQAEAGFDPFLDRRKAEMRAETRASLGGAKVKESIVHSKKEDHVETSAKQAIGLLAYSTPPPAALSSPRRDKFSAPQMIPKPQKKQLPWSPRDTAFLGPKSIPAQAINPGVGRENKKASLSRSECHLPSAVRQSPVPFSEPQQSRILNSYEQSAISHIERSAQTSPHRAREAHFEEELQKIRGQNREHASEVKRLQSDLTASRAEACEARQAAANTASAENVAELRRKYESLKGSYLLAKLARDETVMQHLSIVEERVKLQGEVVWLQAQLAQERRAHQEWKVQAQAVSSQLAREREQRRIVVEQSKTLGGTEAHDDATAGKDSVADPSTEPGHDREQLAQDSEAPVVHEERWVTGGIDKISDGEDKLGTMQKTVPTGLINQQMKALTTDAVAQTVSTPQHKDKQRRESRGEDEFSAFKGEQKDHANIEVEQNFSLDTAEKANSEKLAIVKKRGRPPGRAAPSQAGKESSDQKVSTAAPPKKRGRPPGSTTFRAAKQQKISASDSMESGPPSAESVKSKPSVRVLASKRCKKSTIGADAADADREDDTSVSVSKKCDSSTKAKVSKARKSARTASSQALSPTLSPQLQPAIAKKRRRLLGGKRLSGSDPITSGGLSEDAEAENLLNPALEIPLFLSPVKTSGSSGGFRDRLIGGGGKFGLGRGLSKGRAAGGGLFG